MKEMWIQSLGRSPGGGNGNSLQYSCLGNSMDRGAWQATVLGVEKSWTWLSNWAQHTVQEICRVFCLFIPFMFVGFSQQEYWSGLPFPLPVDHALSELSTMTRPFQVALHGMAHSFIELCKLSSQGCDLWRGVLMYLGFIYPFTSWWSSELFSVWWYYACNYQNHLGFCVFVLIILGQIYMIITRYYSKIFSKASVPVCLVWEVYENFSWYTSLPVLFLLST